MQTLASFRDRVKKISEGAMIAKAGRVEGGLTATGRVGTAISAKMQGDMDVMQWKGPQETDGEEGEDDHESTPQGRLSIVSQSSPRSSSPRIPSPMKPIEFTTHDGCKVSARSLSVDTEITYEDDLPPRRPFALIPAPASQIDSPLVKVGDEWKEEEEQSEFDIDSPRPHRHQRLPLPSIDSDLLDVDPAHTASTKDVKPTERRVDPPPPRSHPIARPLLSVKDATSLFSNANRSIKLARGSKAFKPRAVVEDPFGSIDNLNLPSAANNDSDDDDEGEEVNQPTMQDLKDILAEGDELQKRKRKPYIRPPPHLRRNYRSQSPLVPGVSCGWSSGTTTKKKGKGGKGGEEEFDTEMLMDELPRRKTRAVSVSSEESMEEEESEEE
jgi:hypothetical protein